MTGWKVLGAIVEAVDGRPIERVRARRDHRAARQLDSTYLGIPLDDASATLGDRIVPVAWTGHTMPVVDDEGALSMVPYRIDNVHNEPWHIAKVEPGGGMRGPARELGRFYESLLGYRAPRPRRRATVEMMAKVHRWGLRDAVVRVRRAVGPRRRPSTSAAAPVGARSGTAGWRRHAGSPIPNAVS